MKHNIIEKYTDENIEKIVQELVFKMYPKENLQKKDCMDRFKKTNRQYYEILKDVRVSDLSPSYLVSLVPTLSQKKASYLIRVCVKLVEYGLADNLNRLLYFKERITAIAWSTYKADIIQIFNSDDYEYFKTHNLLCSKSGIKLFFAGSRFYEHINSIQNMEVKTCVQQFLSIIKKSEQYTVETRILQIYDFQEIISLISKTYINEWNRRMFLNVKQKVLCLRFLEFVSQKHDLSDNINEMFKFKKYLEDRRGATKCWQEICSNDIRQCFLTNGQNGETISFYYTDITYEAQLFSDIKAYVNEKSETCKQKELKIFTENFLLSTGKEKLESVNDLSYETYLASGNYFSEFNKAKVYYSHIYSFYAFLMKKYNIEIFRQANISNKLFLRKGILNLLLQGYTIENYNPLDEVPCSNKWILLYDSQYDTGTYHKASDSIAIDFSDINNELFRKLSKMFIWHYNTSINKKTGMLLSIKEALNYINDLRRGNCISIYCKNKVDMYGSISTDEAYAYKMYVKMNSQSQVSTANKIFNFSRFLKVIKENGEMDIQEVTFRFLKTNLTLENNAKSIPDNELNKLIKVIEYNADNNVQKFLLSLIFKIALDTEMRISEILSLDVDCVKETSKNGEYVLVRKRKSASFKKELEPITSETKIVIDKAISSTKQYRDNTPIDIKDKLFIVPANGIIQVRRITSENFRKYLVSCCIDAGIQRYTADNLRDTHMTKARIYKLKHKMSDLEHSVLTGHTTKNVDMNHYVDISIETMLESVYGIVIGDVDINGKIVNELDSKIATIENEVSNGCGYCSNESCDNLTYLDCLMCKNFVTMPSRRYFFEAQLQTMDEKIKNSALPHDKEDIVNIKRLLVKYIAKIKELEVILTDE